MTEKSRQTRKPTNPWARILKDVADLALLGLCVSLVMAWLGRFWWVADLFSHFAVYYAVAAGALVVLALWMRRKRTACVAAVVFIVNAWTVLAVFNPMHKTVMAHGPRLDLVHMNLLHVNRDKAAVTDYLSTCGADIVFVQELDAWWAQTLAEADLPYTFNVSHPQDGAFGIGMLTREGLSDEGVVRVDDVRLLEMSDSTDGSRPAIEAAVTVDGARVMLLSVHPPPPVTGRLAAVRDKVLHRTRVWSDAQQDPHVVIGDLNTTPWSHAFGILTRGDGLRSTQDGCGNQGTWPVMLPMPWMLPIDHCLVSDGLACVDRRVGPETGSDHRPIEVVLAIAPVNPHHSKPVNASEPLNPPE